MYISNLDEDKICL